MKKAFSVSVLFLFVFAASSFAQFEGKITYNLQEVNGDKEGSKEQLTTYFTADRIFVQSNEAMEMGKALKAKGLLIRLDKKDFVFLTGDKKAMSITKAGLTSFMNMFSEMSKQGSSNKAAMAKKDITFKKMSKTKMVNGYEAQKFVLHPNDENDKKAVVWMTKQINLNWGMLAEPWGDSVSFMMGDNFPSKYIFQKGWVPLAATFYEDGAKSGQMSAQVKETDVPKAKVHIPADVRVQSLSKYLFQMMRSKN